MTKYTIGILSEYNETVGNEVKILATLNSNNVIGETATNRLKDVLVSLLAQFTGTEIAVFVRDDVEDSVYVDDEDDCTLFCPPKKSSIILPTH